MNIDEFQRLKGCFLIDRRDSANLIPDVTDLFSL